MRHTKFVKVEIMCKLPAGGAAFFDSVINGEVVDPKRTAYLQQYISKVKQAVDEGAGFILTPEVTNCVSTSRSHQNAVLQSEEEDMTLKALRQDARDEGARVLLQRPQTSLGDSAPAFLELCYYFLGGGGNRARTVSPHAPHNEKKKDQNTILRHRQICPPC